MSLNERSGREEDARDLRVEYRDAQKRLKKHARDSRRAFTAKRNETLNVSYVTNV